MDQENTKEKILADILESLKFIEETVRTMLRDIDIVSLPEENRALKRRNLRFFHENMRLKRELAQLKSISASQRTEKKDYAGIPEEIYTLPLAKLRPYLSTRIYNILAGKLLKGYGEEIGSILRMSGDELLRNRDFGTKSLAGLRDALKATDLLQYSRLAEKDANS